MGVSLCGERETGLGEPELRAILDSRNRGQESLTRAKPLRIAVTLSFEVTLHAAKRAGI